MIDSDYNTIQYRPFMKVPMEGYKDDTHINVNMLLFLQTIISWGAQMPLEHIAFSAISLLDKRAKKLSAHKCKYF